MTVLNRTETLVDELAAGIVDSPAATPVWTAANNGPQRFAGSRNCAMPPSWRTTISCGHPGRRRPCR
ncbi:quinolinate synthase A domain protein [Mycobacterium xenopi 4042]|uniref:Quinolinate synthase A domain protein n=1 Tax=Mycobacterium xenopi 4042 TaxID=1299334 RepID=X8DJ97_MYCXE|nr:quinolinate synthase A domain protein [Mycobacterium xenopi 4042]